MNEKKYKFHFDSGHGWLEVSLSEIRSLGITEKISGYSYIKGDKVFLEEDCDANIFIEAKRVKMQTIPIIKVDDGDYSAIRDYAQYKKEEHYGIEMRNASII